MQRDDGGFPDESSGMRRLDGWVKGYEELQGISTWFRQTFALSFFDAKIVEQGPFVGLKN